MKGWRSCYARTRGVCQVFLTGYLGVYALMGEDLSCARACAAENPHADKIAAMLGVE
jgi:hypothetical protein